MSYLDKVTVGSTTYDIQDSKAQADVADIKSAVDVFKPVEDCPWVREIYINDAGKTNHVEMVYTVEMRDKSTKGYIYFRDTTGEDITGHIVGYDSNSQQYIYGILPIYSGQTGTNLYGYIIIDWTWLIANKEGTAFNSRGAIKSVAYNIDYAPTIYAYLNGLQISTLDAKTAEMEWYVEDTPWIKEMYFLDDTLAGCRLNNVVIGTGTGRLRFANAAGDTFVADTGVISDNLYGVIAIYNTDLTQTLGYAVVNWPSDGYAVVKPITGRAFDIAFSPTIKAYLDNINANKMTVACIGDSITYGTITSSESTEKNYPYWFSRAVGCNVKNYGVPGASCYSYFNQIATNTDIVLDNTIDAAVIMLGTNGGVGARNDDDMTFLPQAPYLPSTMTDWRGTYPDYTSYPDGEHDHAAYLCRIIEYVYEHCGNDTKIVLCVPPYNDYDNSHAKAVINSADNIKQIAAMYRIPVIDVLNEFGPNFITTRTIHSSDYLHFTEDGYRQLGSFIGNKFSSIIGLPIKGN